MKKWLSSLMAKGIKSSGPSGEVKPQRTSFNVDPLKMKKLKFISLSGGGTLQTLVDQGLQFVIEDYEKKNGPIPVK